MGMRIIFIFRAYDGESMLAGTLYEATWMLKVHLHMIYVYFVCGDPGYLRISYI